MKFNGLSESQQKRIQTSLQNLHFGNLIGLELESAEPGSATLTMAIRDELLQNNQVVHGGAIASLIDSAAAFAVIPLLDEGQTATTIDLTISYVRPLVRGTARASAKVLREGSRIIVLSADVTDEEGNLAATGLTTYLRLSKR